MALSVEKTWLMDCGVLRLVNQCRRLIESEFGVKPPLNDEQLREMLAHYAGRTRQRALQEYYARLRISLLDLEGDEDENAAAADPSPATAARRMYRGQPMADDGAAGGGETIAADSPAKTGKTVIYRGRVLRTD